MALILFKWWMILLGSTIKPVVDAHPYFVSVTEINHNAEEQLFEVSCKLFTDDFETALKRATGKKIDLLSPSRMEEMNPLVHQYISNHLKLTADGRELQMRFLGYERDEEGIRAFFEAGSVAKVKSLEIKNNLLYEYHPNQISIIHVTVNGKRKSTKLDNPEEKAEFSF